MDIMFLHQICDLIVEKVSVKKLLPKFEKIELIKGINNLTFDVLLQGRSSSPVGYGIGIAEVVGSNPTRSIRLKPRTG